MAEPKRRIRIIDDPIEAQKCRDYIHGRTQVAADGCWLWIGGTQEGYGSGSFRGMSFAMHRLSYMAFNGPITGDLWVLHRCNQRRCCNPNHLYLGDNRQNMRDAIEAGAIATGNRNGARLHPELLPRGKTHGRAKLDEAMALEIRRRHAAGEASERMLASEYGVTSGAIHQLLKGRTWAHVSAESGPRKRYRATCSSKLTEVQVREIKTIGRSMLQREIAARFGVAEATIGYILCGKRWAHVEPNHG